MPAPIVAYWEALPVWITIGLAVLAALLLATAVWWLWWWLPKREVARLALKIPTQRPARMSKITFGRPSGKRSAALQC